MDYEKNHSWDTSLVRALAEHDALVVAVQVVAIVVVQEQHRYYSYFVV